MKRPTKKRSYRLGAEIQKVAGGYIRSKVEPYASGCLITVTEVRVSDDFKHAAIYFSLLGSEDQKQAAQRAITKGLSGLRREVATKVRMKQIPEFRFVWDDTLESADRIEQLLNKIHDSQSPPDDDDEVDRGNS